MISNDLKASGQISVVPEPADVLMELCSHSLLERSGGVTTSFRFQHQQYQELFAALALMQLLAEALHEADESRFHNLSISYLNLPHWEEAITLIADAIGDASMVFAFGVSATDVGQFLVEKSLSLDPIFSSDLAHRCGASVWERCSAAVGAILRDWHTVENIEHKRLALAGMFASGSDDFIDILQPLLTSEDQQVRLRTYSAYNEIHLTSLGQEWLATVTSWSDEQRSDFIHSIARLDGGDHTALLAHFARTDPVQHIRVEAVRLLIWHGGAYHLEGILGELDDEYFAEAVNTISERESVSPELRQRAIDIFRARFASHSDIDVRLQTALRLLELGDESALGLLKEELERLPQQSVEDRTERLIGAAIDCIRPSDSDFDRIIEGTLWRSHWSKLITNVPIATLRVLVEKGCTQELPRGEREACSELLARVESAELADIIVSRLFELGGLAGEPSVLEGKIEGLLARWFLALVPGLGAESLVNHLSSDLVQSEFEVVISLLGNIPALDYAGAPELADGTRQVLRRYLIDNIDAVLDFEDYSGRIKSMIALALSRVGDLEDLSILERLIRADIERVRSGREARRGGAVGAQANGAAMSFAHWNVEAVIALGAPDTDEVLLSLIREQEYERDAGAGLVRLARPESVEKPFFGQQPRYDDIWAAREGPTEPVSDEDRSALYATAIRQRIAELDDERAGSDAPDEFNSRLKLFGKLLAFLDGSGSSDQVLTIMSLAGEWDGWDRVEALEAFLRSGSVLPYGLTVAALDPTIEHSLAQRNDQAMHLLARSLCIFCFVDNPTQGLEYVRGILLRITAYQNAKIEIVTALGHSRHPAALPLLIDIFRSVERPWDRFTYAWIEAISDLEVPGSIEVLLTCVDPRAPDQGINFSDDPHSRRLISKSIARFAERDPSLKRRMRDLCDETLPNSNREILSQVINELGSTDDILAGLQLMRDGLEHTLPIDLRKGIENLLVGKRTYGHSGFAYIPQPRSHNVIRERLFEMVLHDDLRRKSAFALLGEIECWRLDRGKPGFEPRHPSIDSNIPWPPLEAMEATANPG